MTNETEAEPAVEETKPEPRRAAKDPKTYRVDADGFARKGRGGRKVWVGKTMAGAEVVINDPD